MDRSPEIHACPFCRIVTGETTAKVLYRDDLVTAFRDIHPIASTHILIVPNRHIGSVDDLDAGDKDLVGHMVLTAKQLAANEGLSTHGYRLIMNNGLHGGQTVFHLHLHLLGGPLARFAMR
jgi:Diadenosine tetraphosphate (Ap4A) hydrolase and other HIT family hydrolases